MHVNWGVFYRTNLICVGEFYFLGNFLRGIFFPLVIFYGSFLPARGRGRNNYMNMAPGINSRRAASRRPRMPIVNSNAHKHLRNQHTDKKR